MENNRDNFQIIINDKIYELNSFYNKENEKENDIVEIKLKQIKDITDISYMFNGCITLIDLPNISKLNTNYVTDMRYLFNHCSELLSLPDISI